MNILQNNPYRLLGVYSNSPTKERLANFNRMKAFLKVGKPISFPLDLPQYLPSVNRTEEIAADANARLTLPKDQLLYAQFWFVKISPLDDVAFKNLMAGNMAKAEDIWGKRECVSSLQNRIVSALIREDYAYAVACAEALYGNVQYVNQLVNEVVGSGGNFDVSNLAFSFLDVLCEEVDANQLLPYITHSEWRSHIGEKAVKPLLNCIQEAINIARKSKGKGPDIRLKAGETLRKVTEDALSELKGFLPDTDLQYQMIADKLGLEILQCGIDYYNGSEEPDAALKAMSLQKYAQNIVVGQMAKERCKENVDILQRIIDNLPPSEVFGEHRAIQKELRKYCKLPDEICHAVTLLNNTKPHLEAIKRKLGASNSYYLKISTQVVGNALHNVIEEVNSAQSVFSVDKNDPGAELAALFGVTHLKSVLEKAWEATRIMDGFDMEADFKINRYNENRTTLKKLCNQLNIPTPDVLPKKRIIGEPIKPKSGGNSSGSDTSNGRSIGGPIKPPSSGNPSPPNPGGNNPLKDFLINLLYFIVFLIGVLSIIYLWRN